MTTAPPRISVIPVVGDDAPPVAPVVGVGVVCDWLGPVASAGLAGWVPAGVVAGGFVGGALDPVAATGGVAVGVVVVVAGGVATVVVDCWIVWVAEVPGTAPTGGVVGSPGWGGRTETLETCWVVGGIVGAAATGVSSTGGEISIAGAGAVVAVTRVVVALT